MMIWNIEMKGNSFKHTSISMLLSKNAMKPRIENVLYQISEK